MGNKRPKRVMKLKGDAQRIADLIDNRAAGVRIVRPEVLRGWIHSSFPIATVSDRDCDDGWVRRNSAGALEIVFNPDKPPQTQLRTIVRELASWIAYAENPTLFDDQPVAEYGDELARYRHDLASMVEQMIAHTWGWNDPSTFYTEYDRLRLAQAIETSESEDTNAIKREAEGVDPLQETCL